MEELEYKVALSMVPGMTAGIARELERIDMSPSGFFAATDSRLAEMLGMTGNHLFSAADRTRALEKAEREVVFMREHNIRGVYVSDSDYPPYLYELENAPVMLYVIGEADLNPEHALAVVGTRKCTSYGVGFVEKFIEEASGYYKGMTVVSGLAMGIDASAHNAALANGLVTVAVVAHGLDMVYPAAHRDLARRIVRSGGAVVSEYPRGVKPFQKNFLERNRIVAGLCSVTLVVESEVRGGAMSTANQAFMNNREVMAVPGRVTDRMSAGCNHLIYSEKAHLVASVADFVKLSGWVPDHMSRIPEQKNLFPELEGNHKIIYDTLQKESAAMSVDRLFQLTGINMRDLVATLTDMEFDGILRRLPGARFELC